MPKPKLIETPEKLLQLFKDYVKHESENPMYRVDYVGKEGKQVKTPLETPITFDGFEVYLFQNEIISDLGHYSCNKDGRYSEYVPIIAYIRKHCYIHNFKGAAVKLFDPNLIARKLGIKDSSDVTTNGESINEIKVNIIKPSDTNTNEL
jgi:hypothetical protein